MYVIGKITIKVHPLAGLKYLPRSSVPRLTDFLSRNSKIPLLLWIWNSVFDLIF